MSPSNDYLAKRDSEWMGKLYRFLGLSVGLIIHEKTNEERQEAYNCDITYGTNNEMGLTTCETIWSSTRSKKCSAAMCLPS